MTSLVWILGKLGKARYSQRHASEARRGRGIERRGSDSGRAWEVKEMRVQLGGGVTKWRQDIVELRRKDEGRDREKRALNTQLFMTALSAETPSHQVETSAVALRL